MSARDISSMVVTLAILLSFFLQLALSTKGKYTSSNKKGRFTRKPLVIISAGEEEHRQLDYSIMSANKKKYDCKGGKGKKSCSPTMSPIPSWAPSMSSAPSTSFQPTLKPTPEPTSYPTGTPTSYPTYYPTSTPTYYPTSTPTLLPTSMPTPTPPPSVTTSPVASDPIKYQCSNGNAFTELRIRYDKRTCEESNNSQQNGNIFSCLDYSPDCSDLIRDVVSIDCISPVDSTVQLFSGIIPVGEYFIVSERIAENGAFISNSLSCFISTVEDGYKGRQLCQAITIDTSGKTDLYIGETYGSLSIVDCTSESAQPTLPNPPSAAPVLSVTSTPTLISTLNPTSTPTNTPTLNPTSTPSSTPTTLSPTFSPTSKPTRKPTRRPTREPTREPTRQPTQNPTWKPTEGPTQSDTMKPTLKPTDDPTQSPTVSPTSRRQPDTMPTSNPTYKPTKRPIKTKPPTSSSPTLVPTKTPLTTTFRPTSMPTKVQLTSSPSPTSTPLPRPTNQMPSQAPVTTYPTDASPTSSDFSRPTTPPSWAMTATPNQYDGSAPPSVTAEPSMPTASLNRNPSSSPSVRASSMPTSFQTPTRVMSPFTTEIVQVPGGDDGLVSTCLKTVDDDSNMPTNQTIEFQYEMRLKPGTSDFDSIINEIEQGSHSALAPILLSCALGQRRSGHRVLQVNELGVISLSSLPSDTISDESCSNDDGSVCRKVNGKFTVTSTKSPTDEAVASSIEPILSEQMNSTLPKVNDNIISLEFLGFANMDSDKGDGSSINGPGSIIDNSITVSDDRSVAAPILISFAAVGVVLIGFLIYRRRDSSGSSYLRQDDGDGDDESKDFHDDDSDNDIYTDGGSNIEATREVAVHQEAKGEAPDQLWAVPDSDHLVDTGSQQHGSFETCDDPSCRICDEDVELRYISATERQAARIEVVKDLAPIKYKANERSYIAPDTVIL